jgi:hypothetical protein
LNHRAHHDAVQHLIVLLVFCRTDVYKLPFQVCRRARVRSCNAGALGARGQHVAEVAPSCKSFRHS